MNKKVISIFVVVLAIVGIAYFATNQNKQKQNEPTVVNNTTANQENQTQTDTTSTNKTLVVYFSAQSHTKEIASEIASNLNADLFEITPKEPYTSDDLNWNNSHSRVSREHDDPSLRNIELETTAVPNWDDYDTVLIGYPIWWGIAAWPVDSFIKANDFGNKTVIPFCTSASSGIGQSGDLLKEEAKGGNSQEGERFPSNASSDAIKEFTDRIQ